MGDCCSKKQRDESKRLTGDMSSSTGKHGKGAKEKKKTGQNPGPPMEHSANAHPGLPRQVHSQPQHVSTIEVHHDKESERESLRKQLHDKESESESLRKQLNDTERQRKDLYEKNERSDRKYNQMVKQLEEKTGEINERGNTIRTLNDETTQLRTANASFSADNEQLTKANDALHRENETLKDKSNKKAKKHASEDQKQDTANLRAIIGERDRQIHSLHKQLQELGDKNEGLLKNVSSLMNQTMSRDESDLENINVKNRPMNVMDDFTTFCSQEWLDAKTVIDEWEEEQDHEVDDAMAFQLLMDGIYKCYEKAEELFTATKRHFQQVVENPLQSVVVAGAGVPFIGDPTEKPKVEPIDVTKKGKRVHKRDLDIDFQVSIAKALKLSSDNIDFSQCAKNLAVQFLRERKVDEKFEKLAEHEDVLAFFKRCIEISWNMIIQQPAMKYQCIPGTGGKFNDIKHELHYNSADPNKPGAVIHYFVHPAVFHGSKPMKKARVVLHIPPAWSEQSTASSVSTDTQGRPLNRPELGKSSPGATPQKRHSGGNYPEGREAKIRKDETSHDSQTKGKKDKNTKRTSSAPDVRDGQLSRPQGTEATPLRGTHVRF